MRRTWVIARREYRASVRSKAFLVSLLLMPVLMLGGAAIPKLMRGRVDVEDKRVVIADATGRLLPRLLEAAELRNRLEVLDPVTRRQVEPRFLLTAAPTPTLTDQQRLELSQQIRDGKLHAFAEFDAGALAPGDLAMMMKALTGAVATPPTPGAPPAGGSATAGGLAAARGSSAMADPASEPGAPAAGPSGPARPDQAATGAKPPVRLHLVAAPTAGLARWFARAAQQAIQRERLSDAGIDLMVVARSLAPVSVESLGLFTRHADGKIGSGDERSRDAAMFVPVGVVFLVFLALMMSQTMLQSTLEEKQQRIAEVLLGSVRPSELMLGKVLGGAGVSLTTMLIYVAGSTWMLDQFGLSGLLRQGLLAAVLIFPVVGVLLYGAIFGAVGAACSELKDAQSFVLPVLLVMLVPIMIWWKVLEEPSSAFATALSFVPLWTPLLMPLRIAATEAIPLWQPVVGLLGTLLFALIAVWAGGRVFRVGLLLQGKPPRPMQLLGWILRG